MAEWGVEVSAEGVDLARDLLREVEQIARFTLDRAGAGPAELSIAFLDDEGISALNQDYLSREGPTDVISFPLEGPMNRLVGDIYIGFDQAKRQAEELNLPLREEILRLVVHGTLHALGWGHPEDASRLESPMFARQEELLAAYLQHA